METKRKQHGTPYVSVDTHQCKACWKCVEACPKQVIGKIVVLWHKHIKMRNQDNCIGCGKCVKACQYGAISKNTNV
ncbi:MAG: DUF362 domain-containing protein [Mangrovibacterium sp.]